MALVVEDPRNAGQLGAVETAGRRHDPLGAEAVSAAGLDDPQTRSLVQSDLGDLGREQRVAVEVGFFAKRLAVL